MRKPSREGRVASLIDLALLRRSRRQGRDLDPVLDQALHLGGRGLAIDASVFGAAFVDGPRLRPKAAASLLRFGTQVQRENFVRSKIMRKNHARTKTLLFGVPRSVR